MLEEIEEEKRLIFTLENVLVPSLVVHQKIVDLLAKFDVCTFTFYKLSEYEQGMQY
ncbi:hypothetical protein L4C34_20185 [Vibrio profundum]|uniref:hypothetical protein n=1 Tax=Vibrio profundum TaxID=2910247 RepID=UPI003D14C895